MFGELLESRARRPRNRGGMVASMVGHAALIVLSVMATRTQLTARVPEERIIPLPVLPPQPSPPVPQGPTAPPQPSSPVYEPMPVAPVVVPTEIPPVHTDIAIPIPRPDDWQWGLPGGRNSGTTSTGTSGGGDEIMPFGAGVDKPAMALPGNPAPHYPEVLRRGGVRGEVTIEVVVDTTGRALMESLRIVASDHALLSEAVRAAMARARFLPAETGGRKVRMWVRQSFLFEVREGLRS